LNKRSDFAIVRFYDFPIGMLKIAQSVYDSIRAHGEKTYPHECCGVLLGHDGNGGRVVTQAVRCDNTRIDAPQNRYSIAPKELIRIQLDSRKDGLDILGFYHSHPDHPARWSPTDFAEAHWLGCSYVISAVEEGRAGVTNSFLLAGDSEDSKSFQDEVIETVPD
jgi:proteasome lid subunit RPN8/RPN11